MNPEDYTIEKIENMQIYEINLEWTEEEKRLDEEAGFFEKQKKSVSKSELIYFINNYPRQLRMDVYGVCDPPMISYNDFALGKWPHSVVAYTWAYDNNENGYFYKPQEEREYYIVENHEQLFQAKLDREAGLYPPRGENLVKKYNKKIASIDNINEGVEL